MHHVDALGGQGLDELLAQFDRRHHKHDADGRVPSRIVLPPGHDALAGQPSGRLVDAHDDPKVAGVTCYVSRAKTGGIKGALGIAEDKSEASIACRQVGPISFARPLPVQEEIFSESTSLVFKKLRIVRMVDRARNTLVYLTYSERVIEGSPQNSVTAVAVDRATPIPVK
jgi:CreA protein